MILYYVTKKAAMKTHIVTNQIQKQHKNATSSLDRSTYNIVSSKEEDVEVEDVDAVVREETAGNYSSSSSITQNDEESFFSRVFLFQSRRKTNIVISCCLLLFIGVLVSSIFVTKLRQTNIAKVYEDNGTSLSEMEVVESQQQEEEQHQNKSSPLMVIVTEGGCSGSTAVGHYLRELVVAHGLDYMEDVHFEFFHTNKNPRKNRWKNPFYHNITVEAKASNLNLTMNEMMLMSIKQAKKIAANQKKAMIIKATSQQYQEYRHSIKNLKPTYFGVYRRDALRRCICMIKDCFYAVRQDGYPIFAQNETRTDLCFNRRFQHDNSIQIMLTNARHCLQVTTEAQTLLKTQSFPSLPEEELFLFEYSQSSTDLQTSVKSWARILELNLKGTGIAVSEAKIQEVLEPLQNSRSMPSDYRAEIHNYDEIENSLMEMGVLDAYLPRKKK